MKIEGHEKIQVIEKYLDRYQKTVAFWYLHELDKLRSWKESVRGKYVRMGFGKWMTTDEEKGLEEEMEKDRIFEEKEFPGQIVHLSRRGTEGAKGRILAIARRERNAKASMVYSRIRGAAGVVLDAQELRKDPDGEIAGIIRGSKGAVLFRTERAGKGSPRPYHFRAIVEEPGEPAAMEKGANTGTLRKTAYQGRFPSKMAKGKNGKRG